MERFGYNRNAFHLHYIRALAYFGQRTGHILYGVVRAGFVDYSLRRHAELYKFVAQYRTFGYAFIRHRRAADYNLLRAALFIERSGDFCAYIHVFGRGAANNCVVAFYNLSVIIGK
jgi:hypothetical protein